MYLPNHFEENNLDTLYAHIEKYPLATLVTNVHSGLNAEHLPVYLNTGDRDRIRLQGHIARANPLWKSVDCGSEALVIFQGAQSYISPGWLPSKKEHGKVVPTWNYTAVHVKGKIEFIHNAEWKLALLENLTVSQEQNQAQPWSVSDAPAEFVDKLLPAIVGFELVVSDISGKFKLSQNQPEENRVGIVEGLKENGHEMADLIK